MSYIRTPSELQAFFVLVLFIGVFGILAGLRAISQAAWWRIPTQALGIGVGVVFVGLGALDFGVASLAWLSPLYLLFGLTQIIAFWRRSVALRQTFQVDGIGIALAGVWLALGPSIGLMRNHVPVPPDHRAAAITGALILAVGVALVFYTRRPTIIGREVTS